MYLTIREYQIDQKNVAEVLRWDEKDFVPAISKAEGFREYYTLTDDRSNTLTSVSIFENRSTGEVFNAFAMNWVKQNLHSLLSTSPKIACGEVLTHATGKVLAS